MAVARWALVLLLATLSLALTLSSLNFLRPAYDVSGLGMNGPIVESVAPGSPAAKSGLHVGDRLAGNVPFFERVEIQRRIQPSGTLRFHIVRAGHTRVITLRLPPTNHFSGLAAVYVLLNVAVSLIFVFIGTWLVLARPSMLTWLFFLFCIGPTMPFLMVRAYLLTLPMPLGFALNLGKVVFFTAGLFAFLSFALRFPRETAFGWRKQLDLLVPYGAIAYFVWEEYNHWLVVVSPALGHIDLIYTAILAPLALIAIASLIGTYRSAGVSDRQRLKWAIAGAAFGYAAVSVKFFLLMATDHPWEISPAINITALLQVVAPLALAYAIIRHRVIDVQFVLNRTIVYVATLALLALVFALLDWVFANILVPSRIQIAVDIAVATAIGFTLRGFLERVTSVIDRLFFPKRSESMEQLRKLRIGINAASDALEVSRILTVEAASALALASAALFIRAQDGGFVREAAAGWPSGTAWHLLPTDTLLVPVLKRGSRTTRTSDIQPDGVAIPTGAAQPALIVPLMPKRTIIGLLFYGGHLNGSDIDPNETHALAKLCSDSAHAFDTAAEARVMAPITA